jgi:hypothetical protein
MGPQNLLLGALISFLVTLASSIPTPIDLDATADVASNGQPCLLDAPDSCGSEGVCILLEGVPDDGWGVCNYPEWEVPGGGR